MKQQFAPLFILLAAVFWGTAGTSQAFAPGAAHPIAIGATRMFVGGLFLLCTVLMIGRLNLRLLPYRSAIIAALSMAFYQPLFFSAVSITGVAIGTVVTIGSAPILTGFIEWVFFRRRPMIIWWCSTFLSIAGCLMLFMNPGAIHIDPLGIILALGAGLAFAVYTIVNRDLVASMSALSAVAIVFTLSGLMLSPFLFIFDMSWMVSVAGITVSLHLGILATGIAYYLFAKGLSEVTSSTAVTLSLAEPLTATLLGVLILGEYLSIISWLGILLLLSGIGLLIWRTRRKDIQMRDRRI